MTNHHMLVFQLHTKNAVGGVHHDALQFQFVVAQMPPLLGENLFVRVVHADLSVDGRQFLTTKQFF
jgi:hypothetical protein